jgi:hypothetical protein
MGISRRVELVATSHADELSLRSLADISAITADQEVRIIGGQMASLLLTAFPVPGIDFAAPATPMPPSPPSSRVPASSISVSLTTGTQPRAATATRGQFPTHRHRRPRP